jgi:hypothetical protein
LALTPHHVPHYPYEPHHEPHHVVHVHHFHHYPPHIYHSAGWQGGWHGQRMHSMPGSQGWQGGMQERDDFNRKM